MLAECVRAISTACLRFFGALYRHLTLRLALLLGIVVFVFAVSIDSFQHQASAAAIQLQGNGFPALAVNVEPSKTAKVPDLQDSYLTFNAGTAERLRHSALTTANLTRCRLTTAHFIKSSSS